MAEPKKNIKPKKPEMPIASPSLKIPKKDLDSLLRSMANVNGRPKGNR